MQRIRIYLRQARKAGLNRLRAVMLLTGAALLASVQVSPAADLGLIDAVALKSGGGTWTVLDSRPKGDWEAGHIPGALQFFWDSYTRTDAHGVRYASIPPRELAVALAALGIDENTAVVVYGDADKSWGSEGYTVWLLSWLGHKGPVRLLSGGIQSWKARSLPLSRGPERAAAKKAAYRVDLQQHYTVSTEEVQHAKGTYALVDTRSTFEWLMGRIPGAIHIPWEDFSTGRDRQPLPPAALKKLLTRHGVDTSRPVVYYCLGGVRSAFAWTVHQLSGLPDAKNYKGGWEAWGKRAGH